MKKYTYYTDWDGQDYEFLRDVRYHLDMMLSEQDKQGMDGCPVWRVKNVADGEEVSDEKFIRFARLKKGGRFVLAKN